MDALLYGDLAPDEAERLARRHLSGYDDGELYLQYAVSESLGFDDGRLKTASFDTSRGFGLRAVSGETTGFAHSTEVSAAAIARAAETLALVGPGTAPAPPPRGTNARLYTDANPLASVPFDRKVALLQAIDAHARAADPRVAQVSASLAASWSLVDIVRADGTRVRDIRPLVRLNVGIVAEANGRRESGSWGLGGRHLPDALLAPEVWQDAVARALSQALVNLEAVPAPAGEMPVVLGPGWPGILLHEAVGHGLEGDFNRKGSSIFAGRVGERVAAPGVTVIDDGTLEGRRGSLSVDDEGTPTARTVLIEDGILKGYMQDRLNARLMGVAETGNGRRESYAHAPMPRMTNTFMAAGTEDPAAIIARVDRGIYAKSFGGGQVDIVSGKFVFSCTEAWIIQKGRLTAPIKGATLIGHGPEVMQRIAAIGNDLALDPGIGTCGKAGQSVPAGVGQPTLLVERLTVGGTA
ncbi:MAG: metalloprotease TldD [Thermaurantiacus tibetensis]|uniref:metalloprotease TldD n=1 Tax=Thermaurantiacus tibetensis TaxID=2759035 RepID=UPI001A9C3121|nr:metalloprotease TldD [Thermaurantiacus tibetensis]